MDEALARRLTMGVAATAAVVALVCWLLFFGLPPAVTLLIFGLAQLIGPKPHPAAAAVYMVIAGFSMVIGLGAMSLLLFSGAVAHGVGLVGAIALLAYFRAWLWGVPLLAFHGLGCAVLAWAALITAL